MPLVDVPSLSYGRLVANVLAGAAGRAAAIATALALSTLLVRMLGLAAYGTWSFFFVLIGYQGQFDSSGCRWPSSGRSRVPPSRPTGPASRCSSTPAWRARRRRGAAAGDRPAAYPGRLGWLASAIRSRCDAACWCSPSVWPAATPPRSRGAGLSGLQRTTTLAAQRSVIGAVTALVVIALAAGGSRLDHLLVASACGLLATAAASWRAAGHAVGPIAVAPWRATAAAVRELAVVGGTLQATHLVSQAGDQGRGRSSADRRRGRDRHLRISPAGPPSCRAA